MWNRFKETGNVRRRPGAGRPRATTSSYDRYIQLTARRNRTENATQLQRQLLLATGRRVSSQTAHGVPIQSRESDTRRVLVEDRALLEINRIRSVKDHNTEELVGWWYGWNQHRQDDDNARPHRARLVENMLETETIQRMEWPACSSDLNQSSMFWDMLERHAARPRPPATVRDLELHFLREWNSIPPKYDR
ncbi:uncharacterized protein TNCV_4050771 [Trichonephila clavipes]|nr:uncharacterized protein TNCV_4050771 [Trichonephila clavipes]